MLVEDDLALGVSLSERLTDELYQVSWAKTFSDALSFHQTLQHDVAILDITLPDGDGFELAKKLNTLRKLSILFLTASSSAEHRLRGFELGAEEYIPKPFHIKELLLRLNHVLSRKPLEQIPMTETLFLEIESKSIKTHNDERIPLSLLEFKTLKLLLDQAPQIISREKILSQVYGKEHLGSTRSIDNAIVKLRQILGKEMQDQLRSVRKEGYQWLGSRIKNQS